jgi:hypothetical protein
VNQYVKQSLVRCSVTFRDATGALADPTSITFYYASAAAPTSRLTYLYGTDAQLVRDSLGVYHVDLVPLVPGTWTYGFIGTGTVAIALEAQFQVNSLLG